MCYVLCELFKSSKLTITGSLRVDEFWIEGRDFLFSNDEFSWSEDRYRHFLFSDDGCWFVQDTMPRWVLSRGGRAEGVVEGRLRTVTLLQST